MPRSPRRPLLGLSLLLAACATAPATTAPVAVVDPAAAQAATAAAPMEGMGAHCDMHHEQSPFTRTEAAYTIPALTLTNRDGQPYPLSALATADHPIVLNFIFATCTTVCPVMTATFAQARAALGPEADRVEMVSITIDPQHDTPAVLAEYAQKYEAPAAWAFLTGPSADINAALHAFDADFGSKFNHRPVTLLHAPGAAAWVRLEGLGSGAALADEIRHSLLGAAQP